MRWVDQQPVATSANPSAVGAMYQRLQKPVLAIEFGNEEQYTVNNEGHGLIH